MESTVSSVCVRLACYVVWFALLVGAATAFASPASAQCVNGRCYRVCPAPPSVYAVVPPTVYVPRVEYKPYQYQGSVYVPYQFRTPVRRFIFGDGRIYNYYAPKCQNGQCSTGGK